MQKSRFKYFKVGDFVINKAVWGNKKFIIDKMYGNDYCPIIDVHPINTDKTVGNTCLFAVSETRLIGASKRPFRKVETPALLKILKRGNMEAKRELIIRAYNNKIKNGNGKG